MCISCSKQSTPSIAFWVGAAAALAVLEKKHPASHLTRFVFRTHTRCGRWVFAGAWTGFAVWFLDHINRSPHNLRES